MTAFLYTITIFFLLMQAITDWFTDIRASISDLSEKMHLQELSPHELFEIAQVTQYILYITTCTVTKISLYLLLNQQYRSSGSQ